MEEIDKNLREKAYEIIRRKGEVFSEKFENSDLKTLLHELDVYQAELEAQNEELRSKEHALILSNENNERLFNEAPFPYLLINNTFGVIHSNYLAEKFFNFTRSKKSMVLFSSYIKKGGLKVFLDWIISEDYKNNHLELDLKSFDNKFNKFRLFLKDYSEKENWYLLALRDIQKESDLAEEVNKKNLLLNEITQNQESLLMVYDENKKLIFLNDRFLDFFDSECMHDFIVKYGTVCNLFIKDEHFFSIDTKDDSNWIDIILNSKKEDYVVLLNEKKSNMVKSYLINITKSQTNNYICSFSEVTNLTLERNELQKRVFYDELTHIYNRAKFNDFLKEEFSFFKREKLDLAVIMFDIDFFKDINDNYGHHTGDEVLIQLCEIINERLRDSDIFARWGGEEFVILLKSCQKKDAHYFTEQLRDKIETSTFVDNIKITCSFGVTLLEEEDNINSFLYRVDNLLYKSKKFGRNCISG